MIFDTHCHLGFDSEEDPASVVQRAQEAGVTAILDVGVDAASSRAARERARDIPGVLHSAGLHPNDCHRLDDEWDEIRALCAAGECVAVGETGLDFYRDRTPPALQEEGFARHLELARRLEKPVIVHCRDAFPRVFEVLRDYPGVRGVMHCFSGGVDETRAALELDFYVSFAGPLTYPRSEAIREAARFAPQDRVLVETDAPFLPPQGKRGRRNEPAWITITLARLAELRGWSFEEAAARTRENAERLFGRPDAP